MDSIIQELTELRKARGIRQVDIARIVGVTQPVISELESGKTSPRLATLITYANALGMTIVVVKDD